MSNYIDWDRIYKDHDFLIEKYGLKGLWTVDCAVWEVDGKVYVCQQFSSLHSFLEQARGGEAFMFRDNRGFIIK